MVLVAFFILRVVRPTLASTRPRMWVQDYGLWYADETGRPYLARGSVRLVRQRPTMVASVAARRREMARAARATSAA